MFIKEHTLVSWLLNIFNTQSLYHAAGKICLIIIIAGGHKKIGKFGPEQVIWWLLRWPPYYVLSNFYVVQLLLPFLPLPHQTQTFCNKPLQKEVQHMKEHTFKIFAQYRYGHSSQMCSARPPRKLKVCIVKYLKRLEVWESHDGEAGQS